MIKMLYASLSKLVTDDLYEAKWSVPASLEGNDGTLLTINDKKISGKLF